MTLAAPGRSVRRIEQGNAKLASKAHRKPSARASKTGRDADSPTDVPARGWMQVTERAWRRSWQNNIGLVAAGTAFYAFIAIVPVLVVATILYSWVADPVEVVDNARRLGGLLPTAAVDAVTAQLERVIHASSRARGFGFLGALAVAIFGARNAATALIAALNIAYDEKERRGLSRISLIALTIMGAAFALALALLILLGFLGALRNAAPALGTAGGVALQGISLVAAVLVGAAGAAALYRFAPCRSKAKWKWVTPGSLFAATAWLLLTMGFAYYVAEWSNFAAHYGPSAAGVVTLVWLYFSALIFLFGGEINAELERQTARDTTEGTDKPTGSRKAAVADKVARD